MRLFTYKITHDHGFAPNPFQGVLTLATCKPGIRKTKCVGDWVAGFSSLELSHLAKKNSVEISPDALIYLAKVSKKISIPEYYKDSEFQYKIPSREHPFGDNIYEPLHDHAIDGSDFKQVDNTYHGKDATNHDIGGENVLIFNEFYYLGRNGVDIPSDIQISRPKGPTPCGYKTTNKTEISALIDWVRGEFKQGINGLPCLMENNQNKSCGGCS